MQIVGNLCACVAGARRRSTTWQRLIPMGRLLRRAQFERCETVLAVSVLFDAAAAAV
jgi:hypothetical protein